MMTIKGGFYGKIAAGSSMSKIVGTSMDCTSEAQQWQELRPSKRIRFTDEPCIVAMQLGLFQDEMNPFPHQVQRVQNSDSAFLVYILEEIRH